MEVAAEESFGQGSALRPLLGFYSADLIIHVTVSLEFEIMFLVSLPTHPPFFPKGKVHRNY